MPMTDGRQGSDMAETRSQEEVHEVDVVICTRNREANIGPAVHSVLANDHPSFRLTVIDQSTTDATGEVLAPIALGRRPLDLHPRRRGRPFPRLQHRHSIRPRPRSSPSPTTTASCRPTGSRRSPPPSAPSPTAICSTVRSSRSTADEASDAPASRSSKPETLEPFDGYRGLRDGCQLRSPPAAVRPRSGASTRSSAVAGRFARRRTTTSPTARTRAARHPAATRGHASSRRPARGRGLAGPADGTTARATARFYTKHVRCRDPYAAWLLRQGR